MMIRCSLALVIHAYNVIRASSMLRINTAGDCFACSLSLQANALPLDMAPAITIDFPPHTGVDFVPTAHHDTYDAVNPSRADLSGKVVLITGASKGIGRGIAIAYAQAGASGIVLLARNKSGLEATRKACLEAQRPGQNLVVLPLNVDVTDTSDVQAALKEVEDTFHRLDIVVNNAGLMDNSKSLGDADPSEWWNIWSVNIKGMFNITRAALPLLISSSDGLKTILNLSTVAAHTFAAGLSAYQTSKLAILRLSEIIQMEYADKGIICYALHPGSIATDMADQLPEELHFILVDTLEIAAHSIVFYTKERREWLGGRYISAQWDVDEFLAKKDEIVAGDKLKVRMVV
ncbi:hypothetical protein D9757_013643 [Collybiopsis confluens]|uniref:Uncharacterized protein n=1 Tax=Collybiopsis confluens TaxID=2823264 RepID=A0A8H5LK76_9AGAR|nr:hypothetical protein D9757_013643 [Collybiopsis confluens]